MPKVKTAQTTRDAAELETSATDLMAMVENGHGDEMLASVRTLSQSDFIQILRAVQQLDTALGDYALSWQNSEYWGRGTPYPDEEEDREPGADEIKARVERAGRIAHEEAAAAYVRTYKTILDGAMTDNGIASGAAA